VLVAQARKGEPGALFQLASQYEPEIRIVARVLLGPALRPYLDSVDLVQSVHKSLMLGLRQAKYDISTPEKLVALAVEMVRRKVGRHWRHLRRQQRFDAGADCSAAAAPWAAQPSPQPGPAENAQFRDALVQVCRKLTADEQAILQLRLDGHSIVAIARKL